MEMFTLFPYFLSLHINVYCILYLYIVYVYFYTQYPMKNISYSKLEINQYHVEGGNINSMNIENTEKDSLSQVYTKGYKKSPL